MSEFYLCDTEILGLSHSAVKIYSFLRMVNNSVTHESFYKRSNIAVHCHVSESTVVRSVRELRNRGLVKTGKRFLSSGQQTSNSYILIDNPQLSFSSQMPQDDAVETTGENTPPKAAKRQKGSTAKIRQFRCHPAALQKNLSPDTLKVYSYLSFRSGKAGKTMPAKKSIADDCNVSVSTVSRAIGTLSVAGLIEVQHQTRMETCGNNGNSVNLYIMLQPKQRQRPSRTLYALLFQHPLISTFQDCFLPFHDILPHVMGDTARTISRKKLKQKKKYSYSNLTMSSNYAGMDETNSYIDRSWNNCGRSFLFDFPNAKQGVNKMDQIVGLPVIISARYRIVINSSFRRALGIPETGRVSLLVGKNCLQVFPESAPVSNTQEKNISAGRLNLPMDWVKKNQLCIGDHVFLIAASDCILIRPSVSPSSFCRREVMQ